MVLTPQEAAAQEQATREQVACADAPTAPDLKVTDLKNADCGADGISGFNCGYNQGWKDPGTSVIDLLAGRASILIEPANGQFPPITKEAMERRRARAGGNLDGPEARAIGERCILSFGSSGRTADAAADVQQHLPDRADRGRRPDRGRDGARHPHRAPERQAPPCQPET